MLVYYLKRAVLEFWDGWSGLFAPLPYGDPYLSVVVLFVLVAVSAKFVSGLKNS